MKQATPLLETFAAQRKFARGFCTEGCRGAGSNQLYSRKLTWTLRMEHSKTVFLYNVTNQKFSGGRV